MNTLNRDQSLLKVKAISNKIKCLYPSGMNISCATSKRKRHELQEDFEENLIAELCVRFEPPSVSWLKSTCLPTVLHRITQCVPFSCNAQISREPFNRLESNFVHLFLESSQTNEL